MKTCYRVKITKTRLAITTSPAAIGASRFRVSRLAQQRLLQTKRRFFFPSHLVVYTRVIIIVGFALYGWKNRTSFSSLFVVVVGGGRISRHHLPVVTVAGDRACIILWDGFDRITVTGVVETVGTLRTRRPNGFAFLKNYPAWRGERYLRFK